MRYFDFLAYLDFCEIAVGQIAVRYQNSNSIEFRGLVNGSIGQEVEYGRMQVAVVQSVGILQEKIYVRKRHFVAMIEIQEVRLLSTFASMKKSLAISGFCSTFALEFANFENDGFCRSRIDIPG